MLALFNIKLQNISRPANGEVAGSDVKVLDKSECKLTITCIDNHQVRDLELGLGLGLGFRV